MVGLPDLDAVLACQVYNNLTRVVIDLKALGIRTI